MKHWMIVAAALLVSLPVMGQKTLYRCGNNYQDRPCDGSGPAAAKPAPLPGLVPGNAAAAPAAKVPAAPAPAPAPLADAQKASAPMTKAQQQRQIRCENFGRQREELRERQKAASQQADAVGVQIKSLEARMNADSCS